MKVPYGKKCGFSSNEKSPSFFSIIFSLSFEYVLLLDNEPKLDSSVSISCLFTGVLILSYVLSHFIKGEMRLTMRFKKKKKNGDSKFCFCEFVFFCTMNEKE